MGSEGDGSTVTSLRLPGLGTLTQATKSLVPLLWKGVIHRFLGSSSMASFTILTWSGFLGEVLLYTSCWNLKSSLLFGLLSRSHRHLLAVEFSFFSIHSDFFLYGDCLQLKELSHNIVFIAWDLKTWEALNAYLELQMIVFFVCVAFYNIIKPVLQKWCSVSFINSPVHAILGWIMAHMAFENIIPIETLPTCTEKDPERMEWRTATGLPKFCRQETGWWN